MDPASRSRSPEDFIIEKRPEKEIGAKMCRRCRYFSEDDESQQGSVLVGRICRASTEAVQFVQFRALPGEPIGAVDRAAGMDGTK